jgi:hypothetical protein
MTQMQTQELDSTVPIIFIIQGDRPGQIEGRQRSVIHGRVKEVQIGMQDQGQGSRMIRTGKTKNSN